MYPSIAQRPRVLAQTAITYYHRLSGLNNNPLTVLRSRKSEI